jgi:hypothetical protein
MLSVASAIEVCMRKFNPKGATEGYKVRKL